MASISNSNIVVQAFRLMEMMPISSLGDDSEEAVAAADQYPVVLQRLLEDSDWSFASAIASLAPVAGQPTDDDLPYNFELPGDAVLIRTVWPLDARWRRDGMLIRVDQPGDQDDRLRIRYTQSVENEKLLSAQFRTAAAYALAAELAPRWSASANRADRLAREAARHLRDARRTDRRQASAMPWEAGTQVGGGHSPSWSDLVRA